MDPSPSHATLSGNVTSLSCTSINKPLLPNTKKLFSLRTDLVIRATPTGEEAYLLLGDDVYRVYSADQARDFYVDLMKNIALYVTGRIDRVRMTQLAGLVAAGEAERVKEEQYEIHNIRVT